MFVSVMLIVAVAALAGPPCGTASTRARAPLQPMLPARALAVTRCQNPHCFRSGGTSSQLRSRFEGAGLFATVWSPFCGAEAGRDPPFPLGVSTLSVAAAPISGSGPAANRFPRDTWLIAICATRRPLGVRYAGVPSPSPSGTPWPCYNSCTVCGGEYPPNSTALGKTWCEACRRRHGRDAKGEAASASGRTTVPLSAQMLPLTVCGQAMSTISS